MGNTEDYNAKLPQIMAVPDNTIVSALHIPISEFLKEADELYTWCLPDREKLVAAGLDRHLASDIPVLAGAVREAEAQWTALRKAG